ncbi:peptidase inhibitor family I36 protein [Streptomyces sp. NPDC088560]|uniref:peptidase inhibitor family I36 protein n=1 Tax=Streptomyces sp. NPDC088560 TaxID=3365868 RepID=UPI00380EB580
MKSAIRKLAGAGMSLVAAAGIAWGAASPASADTWFPTNSGSGVCASSKYALCIWDQSNYQGSGLGVTSSDWSKVNQNLNKYYGFFNYNVSSLINNTSRPLCVTNGPDATGSKWEIAPYAQLRGLGWHDNWIVSIQYGSCQYY